MHLPVLLHEVVEYLNPREGDTILDGTVGEGGHAKAICERVGKSGVLIGLDLDPAAVAAAAERLAGSPCARDLRLLNFRDWTGEKLDGAILDLGLRSSQIEDSGRGFSFLRDEPLAMTFGETGPTAADLLNGLPEPELARILREYGEEPFARRIARAIVSSRPLARTRQLAEIVRKAVPAARRHGKLHVATKTFQAIRMAVNDELGSLAAGLPRIWNALAPGGKLAVISFHRLEDRIVKNFFREETRRGTCRILTRKPIRPAREETRTNPRARSARLRVGEHL